jgi:hypothetical protein
MKLAELQQALRAADPAAVLVAPRVLERVIRQACQLPNFVWTIPHKACYVVDRHILFRHVDQDDLDLQPDQLLPPTVILLTRPPAERLHGTDDSTLLLRYWRLLFHATVHLTLESRCKEGSLSLGDVRGRIERIGPVEFEEIRNVLVQESYLLPDASEQAFYIEFAAVYLELHYFAANLLPSYFPAIRDFEAIRRLLVQDLDPDALFRLTRLPGAPAPVLPEDTRSDEAHFYYWKLMHSAERAAKSGDIVRAAIVRTRAARVAPASHARETRDQAEDDLKKLTQRLQAALQLTDAEASEWLKDLPALLDKADQGNQPVEAEILYDLQRVCLDHERDIYALDLVEWMSSGGKRPIKRPLPSQRMVRINKHLRSAEQRLTSARLTDLDRKHLGGLLAAALRSSQEQLRKRFRPLLASALQDVGLAPTNPPERAAFHKIIEELLDRISGYGYLTFGDLRDALSRNQLKLPDLTEPQEFVRGDPLLQLDRRLATLLDGVYRPSEVYVRWLERLSALNFGTVTGRALTWFVTIPFGAAFVFQEALEILLLWFGLPSPQRLVVAVLEKFDPLLAFNWFGVLPPPTAAASAVGLVADPAASGAIVAASALVPDRTAHSLMTLQIAMIVLLGVLLLALIHLPRLRRFIVTAYRQCVRLVRIVVYEVLLEFVPVNSLVVTLSDSLRRAVSSWPIQLFYWYLLKPVVACAVLYALVPQAFQGHPVTQAAVVLAVGIIVNSRIGQGVSEGSFLAFLEFYHLLRAGFLPGLFRWIVRVFKEVTETLEFIIFSVDEWLRFRSGDSRFSLILRTVLGILWFPISYLARFYMVVLIEPGINPIKFPIASVAAKFIYPVLFFHMDDWMVLLSDTAPVVRSLGILIVGGTIWLLPDAFGFLFWETKENWSLYRANRRPTLGPEVIGSHGETLPRLLQPGFHSGTIPRLFARLRRAEREAAESSDWRAARAARHALQEVETSLRHFVERELVALLHEAASWHGQSLSVGQVELASNRIDIELRHGEYPNRPLWLAFEDRASWLTVHLRERGWLDALPAEQLRCFTTALASLYKLAGVDLVLEQVQANLPPGSAGFELTAQGLRVWLDPGHEIAVVYALSDPREVLQPRTPTGSPTLNAVPLDARRVMFGRVSLSWKDWLEIWQKDQDGKGHPRLFSGAVELQLFGNPPLLQDVRNVEKTSAAFARVLPESP